MRPPLLLTFSFFIGLRASELTDQACLNPGDCDRECRDLGDCDSLLQVSTRGGGREEVGHSSRKTLSLSDNQCFQMDADMDDMAMKTSGRESVQHSANKSEITCDWNPTSVRDLADHYEEIFAEAQNNRNAASHLWAKYIIDRSSCLSHEQIVHMFGGFCAVSGSPVGEPNPSSGFRQNLKLVGGASKLGYSYHCCWPCFCDEKDWIRVDTKTLKDKDGTEKQYFFEVIGDPCKNNPPICKNDNTETGCIPWEAPGVICEQGKLKNAILSDAGHPIIGMYFTDAKGINVSIGGEENIVQTTDGQLKSLNWECEERLKSGMQSGMGTIFVNVAKLNPIP
mmetsp:Transcript_3575/g.6542  ORF Transcript_3575/g.6542 Transcript_3575/m.6542 type:complete len:338 (+) Transcript_3575:111-1124(+)